MFFSCVGGCLKPERVEDPVPQNRTHTARVKTRTPSVVLKKLRVLTFGSASYKREVPAGWETVDNSCAICMIDYVGGERVKFLPCKHSYHEACIDDWLGRSVHCPMCHGNVVLQHKVAQLRPPVPCIIGKEDPPTPPARESEANPAGPSLDLSKQPSLPRFLSGNLAADGSCTADGNPSQNAAPITLDDGSVVMIYPGLQRSSSGRKVSGTLSRIFGRKPGPQDSQRRPSSAASPSLPTQRHSEAIPSMEEAEQGMPYNRFRFTRTAPAGHLDALCDKAFGPQQAPVVKTSLFGRAMATFSMASSSRSAAVDRPLARRSFTGTSPTTSGRVPIKLSTFTLPAMPSTAAPGFCMEEPMEGTHYPPLRTDTSSSMAEGLMTLQDMNNCSPGRTCCPGNTKPGMSRASSSTGSSSNCGSNMSSACGGGISRRSTTLFSMLDGELVVDSASDLSKRAAERQ